MTRHCYDGEWRYAKTFEEAQTWAKWNYWQIGKKYTIVNTVAVGGNLDYTVNLSLMKLTNGKYAGYVEMNWSGPDNPPEKTFIGPLLDDPDKAWEQAVEQSKKNGIIWL
jgi:hypothetical protein